MKANRVQAAEYQTIFIVYSIRTKKKKIKEKEHLPTSPCKSKMFKFETQVKMNKNKKGSINTQA